MHAKLIRPILARANRMKTSHWLSSTIFPFTPFEVQHRAVEKLFTNQINPDEHPFFSIIHTYASPAIFSSAVRRNRPFVSCDDMAYHAGISSFSMAEKNATPFPSVLNWKAAISGFSEAQYTSLQALLTAISEHYPIQAVTGHQDIAPDRKTDPGHFFDWFRLQKAGFPVRHG